MSRNAGGEKVIHAESSAAAWEKAVEWAEAGEYGDAPTTATVYLDRHDNGKWIEEGKRVIPV